MAQRKVLIIGLDGATLDLIHPWAEQGRLPNIAKLLQGGASGPLRSTIPASTAPAWPAAMTGCGPGNTGVYDFFYRDPETDGLGVVSALNVRAEFLWHRLNRFGKRTGVLFVPMTYPASSVYGFMVSGIITPDYSSNPRAAYPLDFLTRYGADLPLLSVYLDSTLTGDRFDRLLEILIKRLREKGRIAREAITREPWDFFMLHLLETDVASHGMWKFMGGASSRYRDGILQVYQEADGILGSLLEALPGQQCDVILMSDHGFGPSSELVNIPFVLSELGLLKLNELTTDRLLSYLLTKVNKKVASQLERVLVGFYRMNPGATRHLSDNMMLGLIDLLPPHLRIRLLPHYFTLIDWSRTKAYAVGTQAIFVNLKRKYRSGIVPDDEYESVRQQIIDGLRSIKTSHGHQVAPAPKRKEEIYRGAYLNEAPDIMAFPDENGHFFSYQYLERSPVLSPNPFISGTHRPEGIFVIAGDGIVKGKRLEMHEIIDVAPTVYYLMGVPIPSGLDGRAIQECFEFGYLAEHAPLCEGNL